MRKSLKFFIVLTVVGHVHCFLPLDVSILTTNSSGSRHHGNITREALERTINWFLLENENLYSPLNKEVLMNTETYKWAVKSFVSFVAKPDIIPVFERNPYYHFTAEKFTEANRRLVIDREKVINAIKLRTFDVARLAAGSLFHTLQDFYSSSNWVEIGNHAIKEGLGTLTAFENAVLASQGDATCNDCNPLGECRDNIRRNILYEQKLTSGYYSKNKVEKPEGKCGHGGFEDDFRINSPKGGINKETLNSLRSPHHYHHHQAASMAIDATVDMLRRIYQAMIDDKASFGEFLGLELAKTLCFVIDTTGSMGGEIADVKDLTIRMTKDAEGTNQNFVLVPINDPHPNLIFTTTDANEMIRLLENLRAIGGGDAPEMSMSGMLLAAQHVRFGSRCYVFTDDDAKDRGLEETLKSILVSRKVKMDFKLTSIFSRRKRFARSTNILEEAYKELAKVSGGTIMMVRKGQLREALKVVEVEVKTSKVIIATASYTSAASFSFQVDSTINEIFLEASTTDPTIEIGGVTSPSGLPGNIEVITGLPNTKLLKLKEAEKGLWTVNIHSSLGYSYRVFCGSVIDFTYIIVSLKGEIIDYSPIRGEEYYISVQTYGPVNKDSLSLQFTSSNGEALNEVKIDRSSSDLVARALFPSIDEGFFLSLLGLDDSDIKFRRVNPNVIKTSHVTLELALTGSDQLEVKPGQQLTLMAKLLNTGVQYEDDWLVEIFDSESYLSSPKQLRLPASSNTSVEFEMTFQVPSLAIPGQVVTVSLIASTMDGKVKNSLVYHISVIPEVSDLDSPTCMIKNITNTICKDIGSNSCDSVRWSAIVEVRDVGSGIVFVKATPSHNSSSFSTGEFQKGTKEKASGVYESSCCFPNVTIVAVDGNGNVGRCFLKVAEPPSVLDISTVPIIFLVAMALVAAL